MSHEHHDKDGHAKAPSTVQDFVPTEMWKDVPDEHDYPAAESYLGLCIDPATAKEYADRLRKAPIVTHPAKDLLRASRLELLPMDDPEVKKDLRKVVLGIKLAPVLVVRGDFSQGEPAIIADGYHRMCASYHLSEDEPIPCQIISR